MYSSYFILSFEKFLLSVFGTQKLVTFLAYDSEEGFFCGGVERTSDHLILFYTPYSVGRTSPFLKTKLDVVGGYCVIYNVIRSCNLLKIEEN